jgi:tripartite-type tricarboxylate transporter receptor subunit TctC
MKMLFLLLVSFAVHAQDYPAKPVKFVVGFGAGGPTDVIARIVAQDLSTQMGQGFIVENRALGARRLHHAVLVAFAAGQPDPAGQQGEL